MTEANEMTNAGIKVKIGTEGRELKIRKLALEDLFSALEAVVIADRMDQARVVSQGLSGNDKVEFLRGMTRDLPSGKELQDLAVEEMGTLRGIRKLIHLSALKDQPDLTEEDVVGFVRLDDLDDLAGIVEFIVGLPPEDAKKDDDGKDGAEGNVEKKED